MLETSKETLLNSKEKLSDFPRKYNRLVRQVSRLNYAVIFLGVAQILVELRVFYPTVVDNLSSVLRLNWGQLSEGSRLLIIGVPATIFAAVVAHIINKRFIDPLLTKSSDVVH